MFKSVISDNKSMTKDNLEKDIRDLTVRVRMAETTTTLDQYFKNKITREQALSLIYLNDTKPPRN
ncbi:hypothetical protein A3K64_03070 [Candidatus Micrarchaeota archaeon RBG_16_36_9]|nr:MAG: hypothetical protein A3K64_03070 [Candidatus Micrarchaeota archaeon RBG_16_36_9]